MTKQTPFGIQTATHWSLHLMAPRLIAGMALMYFIIGATPSEAAFRIQSQVLHGVNFVSISDIARYYGFKIWRSDSRVLLHGERGRIEFNTRGRKAQINGVQTYLFFAIREYNGDVMLSERDFILSLDPMLRDAALPRMKMGRIMLDPGHGGKDSGARGKRLREKDLNLAFAFQLRKVLEAQGYEVVLSRYDDAYPTLAQRGKLAREYGASLFISIHANSVRRSSVSGIESFIVTPQGAPATDKSSPEKYAVSGNKFDRYNARLAYEIHRRMVYHTGANDRGIKHKRFQVLREASCPAILLETGFLSNPEEEALLGHPDYQRRLVRAIADGIMAFHHAVSGAR